MGTFTSKFKMLAVAAAGVIILATLVLGWGLAGGLLINWVFPSLGWGVTSILFLVTMVVMIQLLVIAIQIVHAARDSTAVRSMLEKDEDGDQEEYEAQLLSEEQVEFVADQLSESVIARLWAESQSPGPTARHRSRSRRK